MCLKVYKLQVANGKWQIKGHCVPNVKLCLEKKVETSYQFNNKNNRSAIASLHRRP